MKVRITDLLDSFEDDYVRLAPDGKDAPAPAGEEETIVMKTKKRPFPWKQGLAAAAAVAVLGAGGFGLFRLLGRRAAPAGGDLPAGVILPADTAALTETAPGETDTLSHTMELQQSQARLNRLLTAVAQQGRLRWEPEAQTSAELVRFAHLYEKLRGEKPVYESLDGASWEVMTLDRVNEILLDLFAAQVAPGEDLEDPEGEFLYRQDKLWFPAADGDSYPAFAVCGGVELEEQLDGATEYQVRLTVYQAPEEDWQEGRMAQYETMDYRQSELLAVQGSLRRIATGWARVQYTGDDWILTQYHAMALDGDLEGEEEWPQEYPVNNYRLEGEVFAQSGRVQVYRYAPLEGAYRVPALLDEYLAGILPGAGSLALDLETAHGGYGNWFCDSMDGSANLSASSVTGRFCFTLFPGREGVIRALSAQPEEAAMEQAARDFVARFAGLTGELRLAQTQDTECSYLVGDFTQGDTVVPARVYCFVSDSCSRQQLTAQPGLELPVSCGDSRLEDLTVQTFTVTVLPDGTVCEANNYLTRAVAQPDGDCRMIDASDLDRLLSYMTSYAEHDTLVLRRVALEGYSVYFGDELVNPLIRVEYYFESRPEDLQSTEMILPGLFEEPDRTDPD